MANFIFSGFADEISESFDEQLSALKKLNIPMIELRGVDGKSFVTLSDEELSIVKLKLKDSNIKISALGSPIGKFTLGGDFDEHLTLFERVMDIGDFLECKIIRMFSFYPREGSSYIDFENEVFEKIEILLQRAEKRGFTLCHENEKDIYGDSQEHVLKLLKKFNGRLKAVLDCGNFVFSGFSAEDSFINLAPYVKYMHIKDCDENGTIVPALKGNAYIAKALNDANEFIDSDFIITLEPHLMMFTGLSGLSKLDDIKHKYAFKDSFEPFELTYNTIKNVIDNL